MIAHETDFKIDLQVSVFSKRSIILWISWKVEISTLDELFMILLHIFDMKTLYYQTPIWRSSNHDLNIS